MSVFKRKPPEETRGVSDESLKWAPTSNLFCMAMARTLEQVGSKDQPLIEELWKRGRAANSADRK